MKVEDTVLKAIIREKHSLNYGTFYFFDDFVISEINEGVVFDWDKAIEVIELGERFYGVKNYKANYISNRIHDYSVKPQDWLKFFKLDKQFKTFTVVSYRKLGFINLQIERLFYRHTIHSFDNLLQAVNYVLQSDNREPVESLSDLIEN